MKTFIILCSLLIIQTCDQTSKEGSKPIEYRKMVIVDTISRSDIKINRDSLPEKKIGVVVGQDTTLNNIQEKIIAASYDGFAKRNTEKLDEVESFLESKEVVNKNLKNYWIAFINYYKTIIALQLKNRELGSKSNEKGIEILESNTNKNSDDYALLVLLKGMSYSFAWAMSAPFISKDINKLLEKGIQTDNENFRIHYAQGSTDFYTPKEYGGGKKVENSLIKAIELPEKNTDNSQLPTWGKEEAYDLIIRFYLREKQKDKAKIYFDQAKNLFPNSYIIQMHQSKFKP